MKIIDGKKLAKSIEQELYAKVKDMPEKPALAAVLVGDDPASHLYVKLKEKACNRVGITFHKYLLEESASKEEILSTINFLNEDPGTDGILIQLPLPNRNWEQEVINSLSPEKDADGFHPETTKNIQTGNETIIPGLAAGIVNLIKSTPENLENKHAIIICNTNIFGDPIKLLLAKENVSTEIISPKDENFNEKTKNADIIIIAIGQKNFLIPKMVKESTIIIDVGINKTENGVTGDADYDAFSKTEGYITPVPGGVGPMTVSMLLYNVWKIKEAAQ